MSILGDIYKSFQPTREEKATGLLGQYGQMPEIPQGGISPEEFQGRQYTPQGGTGFLGSDQGTAAQFELLSGLLGAGYAPSEAGGLLATMKTPSRFGAFKTQSEALKEERAFEKQFKADVKPFRQKIQYYNDTAALGKDINKWSGTDDFIAIRNLLKQSLPDESVMGDDISNLKFSQGVPEAFRTWIASMMGKGGLSTTGRMELMSTMRRNANEAIINRDIVRTQNIERTGRIEGIDAANYMLEPKKLYDAPFSSADTNDAELLNKYGL